MKIIEQPENQQTPIKLSTNYIYEIIKPGETINIKTMSMLTFLIIYF